MGMIIFSVFMAYRNQVVYEYRIRILRLSSFDIEKRLANYDKLPSYDTMLWQLTRFNWDDSFQKNHDPLPSQLRRVQR